MAKQAATAYVFMEYDYHEDANGKKNYSAQIWAPAIWKCRVSDEEHRVFIGTQSVEVDIPDDFNPIPAQVAALEKSKRDAMDAYQRTVAEINDRLSKLLAITN